MKWKLGILAYGSLIDDPGWEIDDAAEKIRENDRSKRLEIETTTPFQVEFARTSTSRGGAPTLVPVNDGEGKTVRARIIVLKGDISPKEARDRLYRREIHRVGDQTKEYVHSLQLAKKNSVIVEGDDKRFPDFGEVLYTKLGANIPKEGRTGENLARYALESTQTVAWRDGISYLIEAKRNGIKTPLSDQYEEEIKKQAKAKDLYDALRIMRNDERAKTADENKRYGRDEQTGKLFEIVPETKLDTTFAIVSFVYLLLALGFFLWMLFDTWARKYTLIQWLGYSAPEVQAHLNLPFFRSFAYVFVGGALGGVIAGLRSCINWHSEQRAFGWQFVWRYVFFPWLGATLALFVYGIIGSGISVIGGNVSFGGTNMLMALALGSLVGYGSLQVVRWLDSQVNRLFKVPTAPEAQVPGVIGLTQQEAEKRLAEAGLKIDRIIEKQQKGKEAGNVIEQEPPAGSVAPREGLVKITIAAAGSAEVEGGKQSEGGPG